MSDDEVGAGRGGPGRRRVFVFLAGQHDNVGDVLLRRGLVTALRGTGDLHVFTGTAPRDFVDGLDLPEGTVVHTSFVRWVTRATAAAFRPGSSAYVLNAGEISSTAHDGLWHAALLPALVIGRATRNPGIRAGVGARDRAGAWQWPIVAATRLCVMNVWRDARSRALYGSGDVAPDWAFDDPRSQPRGHARQVAALTFRGDRPALPPALVSALGEWLDRHELVPVVVTQVERDASADARLARQLGAQHVGALPTPLAEREVAAREAYRRSALVLSNRIHALILGGTEGAAPIGLMAHPDVKVGRTMAAAGLPRASVVVRDDVDGRDHLWDSLDDHWARLHESRTAVAEASTRVRRTAERVRAVLRGRTIRVMHSMRAPDGRTRFVDQMLEGAGPGVLAVPFSWPHALLGGYDVLHVHWPEALVRHHRAVPRAAKRVLTSVLLLRLAVTRARVVRTLHNAEPHERGDDPIESRLLREVDRRTSLWVRLTDASPAPDGRPVVTVPHGHYRGRYGGADLAVVPGRILQFGLIRPYKGVERHLEVFAGLDDPGLSLRIVGKALDADLAATIERSAAADPRITARLEFVEDDVLAEEVRQAQLVVLPYSHMHNSGALLVALSLDRPVLAPRTPVNEALADEVGPGWIHLFDGLLDANDVRAALAASEQVRGRPRLEGRDWTQIGRELELVYRRVLRMTEDREVPVDA